MVPTPPANLHWDHGLWLNPFPRGHNVYMSGIIQKSLMSDISQQESPLCWESLSHLCLLLHFNLGCTEMQFKRPSTLWGWTHTSGFCEMWRVYYTEYSVTQHQSCAVSILGWLYKGKTRQSFGGTDGSSTCLFLAGLSYSSSIFIQSRHRWEWISQVYK